jgi:hypothetical protein
MMKKHVQRDKSRPARRVVLGGVIIVIVIAVIGALYFLDSDTKRADVPVAQEIPSTTPGASEGAPLREEEPPEPTASVTKPVDAVLSPDTLEGRWLRTDGDYIIEVVELDAQGNLRAAYYNPRPINVSKAEAYLEQPIRLFIELKDAGYDGSNYNLTYDVSQDVLRGTYFQATYGQTYQVVFVRQSGTDR